MSKNKSITFDGFSDLWLKETKKKNLIDNLWNTEFLSKVKDFLCCRLIPLNKEWPNIPKSGQFRPIFITSGLFRFIELRFFEKLNLVNKTLL